MKEFDYSGLKSEIEAFYDLKKTNSPYDYKKWKISSTDDNCLASKTSRILTRIRDQIEILCKDFAQDNAFEVRICKGASYFPKIPWIGVFFNGERATDGVYPFMSFPDAGIVIGCVESLVEPQQDFSKEYGFPPNVIGENRKSGRAVFDYLDEHYSKKSVCIEENALSENAIRNAFSDAIKVYLEYRGHYPRETRKWFMEEKVRCIEDLMAFIRKTVDKNEILAYRGQGDADWRLESGLGRSAHPNGDDNRELDIQKIIDFEQESMCAFKGEIARIPEYQRFSGIDLLALMQHYGSKTRLLDFTFSPLIALYMAVEQYDAYVNTVRTYEDYHCSSNDDRNTHGIEGIAVWEVDLCSFAVSDCQPERMPEAPWKRAEMFNKEANDILSAEEPKKVEAGIDVIVPAANSIRCSAQEGLFLMPRRMSESFRSNLNVAMNRGAKSPMPRHVVKYVISTSMLKEVRGLLDKFRITPKLIYPDLTGLAKSMNLKLDL